MDPRGSPQRVGDAHLADQPAYFQRNRWPATTRSRLPAPVQPETRPMPTNNGAWLHDRQRIANFREQPIQTNEYQSVDGTEGKLLWSSSPQMSIGGREHDGVRRLGAVGTRRGGQNRPDGFGSIHGRIRASRIRIVAAPNSHGLFS